MSHERMHTFYCFKIVFDCVKGMPCHSVWLMFYFLELFLLSAINVIQVIC